MPIAACAQKLKDEYRDYPPTNELDRPNFPIRIDDGTKTPNHIEDTDKRKVNTL